MRTLYFLTFIFCSIFLNGQSIQIEIPGQNGLGILTLNYWESPVNHRVFKLQFNNGTANALLDIDKPTLAFFELNNTTVPVYLRPNSKTTMIYDGNSFSSPQAENNLLAKVATKVGSFKKIEQKKGYLEYYILEGLLAKSININTIIDQSGASSSFKRMVNNWITIEKESAKLYEKETLTAPLAEMYVGEMGFDNYLLVYALAVTPSASFSNYRSYQATFDSFSKRTQGNVRSAGQKEIITNIYASTQDDDFLSYAFDRFQSTNNNAAYKKELVDLYGSRLGKSADVSVPDILFMNEMGNMGQLRKYKGKVVYLSFWASWCKPCIAGFKKTEATRKELQRMGVVLMNVSIDKTEDLWRKSLNMHQPLGLNVWATDLPGLANDFQITSIPLYHIIDKKGHFAYLSEQQGRDIYAEFRKLVNE